MKRLNLVWIFLLAVSLNAVIAQEAAGIALYKNPKAPVMDRVKDLMSKMTLQEKIGQLNQGLLGFNTNINNIEDGAKGFSLELGSYIYFSENAKLRDSIQHEAMTKTRLGIPILFGFDVIHGFRTIYPIPLAQACSWNLNLAKQACGMAAQEAKNAGVNWTFSPMIDVARDARWGRVAEGYGEDPYVNGMFAVAAVQGYQGENLSEPNSIAACLKHYVGYGMSEGGRDYSTTNISRQGLWDTYLPPYEAGVKAGAATLMSAFNDINGIPASGNYYTLTEVLKKRWNHKGFVVSDWHSVEHIISQGVASTRKEAAKIALMAGVDMDMKDNCYLDHLEELVSEGQVPMDRIDDAVERILRLKFELGLFEQPYALKQIATQQQKKSIAAQAAAESMVLLKNVKKTLPLIGVGKIAIVGPMVKDKENLIGSWNAHGKAENVESLYEGLEKEFGGKSQLLYARGCDFAGTDTAGFSAALNVARAADVVVVCLGEKVGWTGENTSRSTLSLPSIQEQLLAKLKEAGKPIVLVLSNGRPLELCRMEPLCDAILEIWQPGIAGGTPFAGILSGRINPSGKLAITFPFATGQIPIYYSERQRSRPHQGKYQDIPSTPLYEFAHGLSYTTFRYGEMKISKSCINDDEKVTVEIPVTNTGNREGLETVHWFVSDPFCSISRPVKELKYFEKRAIKSGETVVFHFEIEPIRDLSFVDESGKRLLEAGDYFIHVKEQKIKIELSNRLILN